MSVKMSTTNEIIIIIIIIILILLIIIIIRRRCFFSLQSVENGGHCTGGMRRYGQRVPDTLLLSSGVPTLGNQELWIKNEMMNV